MRHNPLDTRCENRWGFFSFPTEDDARAYLRQFPTTRWYIWRLLDGTFDFTSTPSPRQHPAVKDCAELMGTQTTGAVPGRGTFVRRQA